MPSATDLFSEWALKGKDAGMETGHAASVGEMLDAAKSHLGEGYTALDLGCGNGWVVRALNNDSDCAKAIGVDGSQEMINKARSIDSQGEYHHALLPDWNPSEGLDLIHSMEFLYYLDDPSAMISQIHGWLNQGGVFVAGVDHYLENEDSHDWGPSLGVKMALMSESEWEKAMLDAGFSQVTMMRCGLKEGFVGTLVMLGIKA